MEEISKKSWMKFGLDAEMLNRLVELDRLHSNAVSVWLQAAIYVKNMGGRVSVLDVQRRLCGRHLSRKMVLEILLATGDFELDEASTSLVLSSQILARMTVCVRKNSPANAFAGEKMHEQNPSNAPTRNITLEREKREEENISTDSEKTVKETAAPVEPVTTAAPVEPVTTAAEPAPLEAERRLCDERIGQRSLQQLRDVNYTPSAQVMAQVPAEVQRFRDEYWFPYVCWLYDRAGMERWTETLRMQHRDPELLDLVCRHWPLAVTSFVEHAYLYGTASHITSKVMAQTRFALYLRPARLPARRLKARLRWQELTEAASDPREQRFYAFLARECPHLVEMDRPLTYAQFDALRTRYGKPAVLDVLRNMENDPQLNKRDAFTTAQSWLARRERGG